MTRPPAADPLEELLSDPAELDGAEFTRRLLERLPPRRPSPRSWILGAGAVVTAAVGAGLLALAATSLPPALLAILDGRVPDGTGLLALLTLAAVGATAGIVVAGELEREEPAPA